MKWQPLAVEVHFPFGLIQFICPNSEA